MFSWLPAYTSPSIHMFSHMAAAWACSRISGGASRVPLHLGYLEQPRKKPRRPGRSFMGAPHSGQVSRTSTAGTVFLGGGGNSALIFSFISSGIGLVLRHLG